MYGLLARFPFNEVASKDVAKSGNDPAHQRGTEVAVSGTCGSGRNRKRSKGFAHRFRPTYAGANMGTRTESWRP